MDIFQHLSKDEIEVECLVRNINLSEQNYLNILEEALRNEAKDLSSKPSKTHVSDTIKELNLCRERSEQFSKLMDKVEIYSDLEKLRALETRVRHWNDRTSKLKGIFHQDNEVDLIMNKWRRIRSLISEYIDSITNFAPLKPPPTQPSVKSKKVIEKPSTEGPSNYLPIPEIQKTSIRTDNYSGDIIKPLGVHLPSNMFNTAQDFPSTIKDTSIPFYPWSNQTEAKQTSIPNPYYGGNSYNRSEVKWNIKFSGSRQDLDIHDFLFRLEAYAEMDRIPLPELTSILPKLLYDMAEKWYWVFRRKHPRATYDQLRKALIIIQ